MKMYCNILLYLTLSLQSTDNKSNFVYQILADLNTMLKLIKALRTLAVDMSAKITRNYKNFETKVHKTDKSLINKS